MTREEAIKLLRKLRETIDRNNKYGEAEEMGIQALEQEPCGDKYVKVPKGTLKYRTAGMVAYNVEWLKDNFDVERDVICGAKHPCEDAISREDALMALTGEWTEITDEIIHRFIRRIKALPSVNSQEKTGHWYRISSHDTYYGLTDFKCSKCGKEISKEGDWLYEYCPICGSPMMIESQKSENKERSK